MNTSLLWNWFSYLRMFCSIFTQLLFLFKNFISFLVAFSLKPGFYLICVPFSSLVCGHWYIAGMYGYELFWFLIKNCICNQSPKEINTLMPKPRAVWSSLICFLQLCVHYVVYNIFTHLKCFCRKAPLVSLPAGKWIMCGKKVKIASWKTLRNT